MSAVDHSNPPKPPPEASPGASPENAEWIDVCATEQIPSTGGLYVPFQGRGLAVFRLGSGQVQVMDDSCPHAGGSLSAGGLEEVDGRLCVICPWHGWPFDARGGQCPDNPVYQTRMYPVRVVANRVQIQISSEARKPL